MQIVEMNVGFVWREQQAHMAHPHKHQTTVNIKLFAYLPASPINYTGDLWLCREQTLFQKDAAQAAEDACPFPHPLRSNFKQFTAALYISSTKAEQISHHCSSFP